MGVNCGGSLVVLIIAATNDGTCTDVARNVSNSIYCVFRIQNRLHSDNYFIDCSIISDQIIAQ